MAQAASAESDLLGFSVAPNPNCPHVASPTFSVHQDLVPTDSGAEGKATRRNLYKDHCACKTCGDAEETWVCLTCSFSGCSRYRSAHMVCHATDESNDHSEAVIAISLADLSAWCFACDDYITHPKLEPAFREFHRGKFGSTPSNVLHSFVGDSVPVMLIVDERTKDVSGAASTPSNKEAPSNVRNNDEEPGTK